MNKPRLFLYCRRSTIYDGLEWRVYKEGDIPVMERNVKWYATARAACATVR